MVVPNLVGQALRGEPLTVFGDGHADPLLLLRRRHRARAGEPGRAPARRSRAGVQSRWATRDLDHAISRDRIIELTGANSHVQLVPYAEAYGEGYEDMRRRVPDNSKAQAALGFSPDTSLDEIIHDVAEGLKNAQA